MSFSIVSDSSSNLLEYPGVDCYATVPLKINIDGKEYADDRNLDVAHLVEVIEKSQQNSTSCPNAQEWMNAFADAEECFGITISSALSASYSAAIMAEQMMKEENPDSKVHIFDSRATGGTMQLIAEKIVSCKKKGMSFEETVEATEAYQKKTQCMFLLFSLHNLAKNGRLSPSIAKIASALRIHFVGKASEEGTILQTAIARGSRKALSALLKGVEKEGYEGGRMIISHCLNLENAEDFAKAVKEQFPSADIVINADGGLCSYYAERGGLIVCFERK